VSVFGVTSRARTAARLAQVGYVAQDHPLYRDFSIGDMFHLGRAMNPSWDQQLAQGRMDALDIPLKRKVKALSGGQRAQVSLTMALAKRAPLLVLDEPVSSLEFGTWRLAWSQTVTRTRWLAVKLALVTSGVIVLGAAITAVITWYRAPMDRLTGHFINNAYDFEGLVLTAYVLCAFGFAVLAGLLIRRSIPAMIVAFVPWLAVRLVVEYVLRPHFQAPLTFRQSCPSSGPCFGGSGLGFIPPVTGHIGDWVLGSGAGQLANQSGHTYLYQPADRFWTFQSIEAGIFVALTAVALGATIWLLHRRPRPA
jgi:hypothetical protein